MPDDDLLCSDGLQQFPVPTFESSPVTPTFNADPVTPAFGGTPFPGFDPHPIHHGHHSIPDPIAVLANSQRLQEMNIQIVPIDYPANFDPTNLLNYGEIVDGFCHVLYPGLFEQLGVPPITGPGAYYDDVFAKLAAPFKVYVQNMNSTTLGCGGNVGQAQTDRISLLDCADQEIVIHEIGHIIQEALLRQIQPPYMPAITPPEDPTIGSTGTRKSNLTVMGEIFQTSVPNTTDSDSNTTVGYVTEFATRNYKENFAYHFEYYVYYGPLFRRMAENQAQKYNSNLLWQKYSFIAGLYYNIWFGPNGQLGGFPGFSG